MKNIFAIILLFAGVVSAQVRDIDGIQFEILSGDNLRINTDRYNVIDLDLSLLEADNLWLPLWRPDQLEQWIPIFRDTPIDPRSTGQLRLTADITQRDSYGTGERLIRITKVWETWYFHSGTSDPNYGYTLGVIPGDDTGGRHDTSLDDVRRRAIRDAAGGVEIGIYRFTRITYDAYRNENGVWLNVPGLDQIIIHTPYQLVETH